MTSWIPYTRPEEIYAYRFKRPTEGRDWAVIFVVNVFPFAEDWIGNVYKDPEDPRKDASWKACRRIPGDCGRNGWEHGGKMRGETRRDAAQALIDRWLVKNGRIEKDT